MDEMGEILIKNDDEKSANVRGYSARQNENNHRQWKAIAVSNHKYRDTNFNINFQTDNYSQSKLCNMNK